jgi:hypothetical protein
MEVRRTREEFLRHLRAKAIAFYDIHHPNETSETLPVESTNTASTNDIKASRNSPSSSDSQKVG